ncbi:RluA family pseudouridine synthase [Actinokineospora pegani]|uniref:RluA family pseudouridine synthase n=1 Tax=Actinokineospora pegani TaxID=2654637 RepID=UPI0012EA9815|nr:RNA pseudouridine synthase [Actinokineospora pegani]
MEPWARLRARTLVVEDESVLALNKPAGVSVTGERHDTDLVRMAAEDGEELFPVHRIDKVTSGLILFARTLPAHGGLTRQFAKRTADKAYLAITATTGLPARGTIDLPLSVGRKNRVRIAAPRESIHREGDTWTVDPADVLDTRTYPSTTEFTTLWSNDTHTLLAARPRTGRRHQIRVHLAWTGHPLHGDPLFDRGGEHPRTALHSWRLGLDGESGRLDLSATPGEDFWAPVADSLGAQERGDLLARS